MNPKGFNTRVDYVTNESGNDGEITADGSVFSPRTEEERPSIEWLATQVQYLLTLLQQRPETFERTQWVSQWLAQNRPRRGIDRIAAGGR